uniref:Uncharacterized protein n=1 Tax=Triticum urartu TaxID=4572 RepID=A0A8R7PQU2_TRIUA
PLRQPTQPSEQPPSLPYFLLCLPRTLAAATNAGRFRLLPAALAGAHHTHELSSRRFFLPSSKIRSSRQQALARDPSLRLGFRLRPTPARFAT